MKVSLIFHANLFVLNYQDRMRNNGADLKRSFTFFRSFKIIQKFKFKSKAFVCILVDFSFRTTVKSFLMLHFRLLYFESFHGNGKFHYL